MSPITQVPVCTKCVESTINSCSHNDDDKHVDTLSDLKTDDLDQVANLVSSIKLDKWETLTELNLSDQGLNSFPNCGGFKSLKILDISKNKLCALPEDLKEAMCLRILDISNNQFSSFPDLLTEGLPVLRVLNLSYNTIKSVPPPSCLQHLKELRVRSCRLTELPDWIWYQRHCLEILDLSLNPVFEHYKLRSNAVFHSSCRYLKHVYFSNTYLSPSTSVLVAAFTELEQIDISNTIKRYSNRLMYWDGMMPNSIKHLKAIDCGLGSNPDLTSFLDLETVNLSQNPLTFINSKLPVVSIKFLVLSRCYVCSLPNNVGDMINLEHLDLNENDLTGFPLSFASLSKLKYLDIYCNCFSTLPAEIEHLKQLESFDICMNDFQPPSHPLGSDLPSYEELRTNLRAQLSVDRISGMRESTQYDDQDELSDDSSTCTLCYSDEENEANLNKKWTTVPPEKDTDECWDIGDSNDIYNDINCTERYKRSCSPAECSYDANQFFAQTLHLVPLRIRNSPFYYHRISTDNTLKPTPHDVDADGTVEGQFDD